MEKNAAAGRTPTILPMSTPPPASINLSPKLGSLSPIHTNPLNDAKSLNTRPEPTNFNLPPTFTENERPVNAIDSELRQYSGDQRNDRVPPAVAAVTSGTLDAIRERMKSIQLVAAAGNRDPGNRLLTHIDGNLAHGVPNSQASDDSGFADNAVQSGVLPMDEQALSGLQARQERLKSGSTEPM